MGKRKICPRCGSNHAARITYGLVDIVSLNSIRGDYVLGGCVVDVNSPNNHCRVCGYEWGGDPMIHYWDITKFEASIGGHFGPSVEVTADFGRETLTYLFREEGLYEIPATVNLRPLTEDKKNLLLKTLDFCDFVDWLYLYNDNTILDGSQWSVELELINGMKISKSGSNSYPGRWKYFCKKISEFAEGHFQ